MECRVPPKVANIYIYSKVYPLKFFKGNIHTFLTSHNLWIKLDKWENNPDVEGLIKIIYIKDVVVAGRNCPISIFVGLMFIFFICIGGCRGFDIISNINGVTMTMYYNQHQSETPGELYVH